MNWCGAVRAVLVSAISLVPAAAQHLTHVSGWVHDPSDAAVPGASVMVVNEDTGYRRTTYSRPDGGYAISSLQPGAYKITVRKEGFRTLIRFGVRLEVAQPARLDFALPLGSMHEAITVEGGSPALNTADASIGTLVTRDRIQALPLNGRGLLSLLELAPGTVVTPATRGEAGQFTANGQRPNMNHFSVDGVSLNSGVSLGGLPAQSTGGTLPGMTALGSLHSISSLEAVDEFRVQTSTTAAEFGRLPGAQVSLSTRSGSNEWHGSAAHFFRHERLDANDWFANRNGQARAPLRMNDFSASAGGPLRRDRAFFFAAYEGMRLRQPFAWREPLPTVAARETAIPWARRLLELLPQPSGPLLGDGVAEWTGRHHRPGRFDAANARIDYALTSAVSIFGRYRETPSSNQFGGATIGILDMESRGLTLGVNARLSHRVAFDVRSSLSAMSGRSSWSVPGAGSSGGCYLKPVYDQFDTLDASKCDLLVRLSIAGGGRAVYGREGSHHQRQWHFAPAGDVAIRGHQLRGGFDYRKLEPARREHNQSLSVIAESLPDLISGRNLWIGTSPPRRADAVVQEFSLFVQDTWRLHPRLTANLGLRWEFTPPPARQEVLQEAGGLNIQTPQEGDIWPARYDYLGPRVGLAYRPFRSDSTVVRSGFGIYHASSLSIATDLVNGGPFNLSQYLNGRFGLFASLLRYGFAPDLQLPVVKQWTVALERPLGVRDAVSASYVGSSGRQLLRREIGGPESTTLISVAVATNNGAADYHALQLQYRKQAARNAQALVSYAWSHSIDNSSSDASLHWAGEGFRALEDRGSSDFDVRHAFTAALTWESPLLRGWLSRWAVDGIVRARSGFPVNVQTTEFVAGLAYANIYRADLASGQPVWIDDRRSPGGRRLNRAAFLPNPPGVQGSLGRNAVRGFGMSQIDMALRREISLTDRAILHLRVEAFNLLNSPNFADPLRFLSSALFGDSPSMLNMMLGTGSPGSGLTPVLQTGGARSLQIVLRLRF